MIFSHQEELILDAFVSSGGMLFIVAIIVSINWESLNEFEKKIIILATGSLCICVFITKLYFLNNPAF